MHARIRADALRRDRRRRAQAALAAGVVVALVGWLALAPRDGRVPVSPELDLVRLSLGQRPGPIEALTIPAGMRQNVAAARVPLPKDDVVFYRIASVRDDVNRVVE